MHPNDIQDRMKAAYQLLLTETTTREKFESIRKLIKGLSPQVDKTLDETARTLTDFERFAKGEIIELSADHLPENTEDEKKRKKALLLLIKSWKQLQNEVERVQKEFDQIDKGNMSKTEGWSKILLSAKGPVGLITFAAVIFVGAFVLFESNKTSYQQNTAVLKASQQKEMISVIEFNSRKIALSELAVRNGPDCDSPHYHARNHISVTALDGDVIQDPGGCAFGKVKEVTILQITKN